MHLNVTVWDNERELWRNVVRWNAFFVITIFFNVVSTRWTKQFHHFKINPLPLPQDIHTNRWQMQTVCAYTGSKDGRLQNNWSPNNLYYVHVYTYVYLIKLIFCLKTWKNSVNRPLELAFREWKNVHSFYNFWNVKQTKPQLIKGYKCFKTISCTSLLSADQKEFRLLEILDTWCIIKSFWSSWNKGTADK